MKYKLEIRTTISATPYFFRRIHFMAASLRDLPGIRDRHELIVSVGGGEIGNFYRTEPWSNLYPLIWRAVPEAAYKAIGYRATNRDRASHMARSSLVMMADADVIFMRDFSSLLEDIEAAGVIGGVMAHRSPFGGSPELTSSFAARFPKPETEEGYWALLARQYGIDPPALEHQYSGWSVDHDNPQRRMGPVYFNGGMIVGPAPLMETMCALYEEAENCVDDVLENSIYRPQIARTLATLKAKLPYRILPFRYNFRNDPKFDDFYSEELEAVSMLHYQDRNVIHRDEDFETPEAVDALVARADLEGSNEHLRRRIAHLWDVVREEEGLKVAL